MEIKEKRILSKLTFCTLVVLAIVMSVGFIMALTMRTFPFWAKIVYYVWSGAVIATVLFDVYCTRTRSMKFIAGILVYILTMAAIAMSIIIYMLYTTKTGLPIDLTFVFTLTTALSYASSLFMIAEFVVGEAFIEHKTSAESLKQRGIKQ